MESSSARAWTTFRTRLADHLAAGEHDGQQDGVSVCLDVPVPDETDLDGSAPYLQLGWEPGVGLSAEVSSNAYLDASCALTPADEGTLLTLGWAEPDASTRNYHLVLDERQVDRMASLVVRTLREVFDVLHPSFLSCDVPHLLEQSPEPEPELPLRPSIEIAAYERDDVVADGEPERPPTIQFPTARDEVVTLVDATMAWFLGHDPYKDDDGDVPIVCGQSVVYVRVPREPAVLVLSDLVRDVGDDDAALFEVNVLNRDHPDVQFSYADGVIRARRRLPVFPFVARQVHDAVEHLCGLVEEIADDLAHRVDGRLFLDEVDGVDERDADDLEAGPISDEAPRSTDLAPEVLTMLQLEVDRPGSLDAELVASIFHLDRDLLLAQITSAEREELDWQAAATMARLAEDDDLVVLEGELGAVQRRVHLLRGALRVVVEAEAARLRETGRRFPRQRRSAESGDTEPHRSIPDQETR